MYKIKLESIGGYGANLVSKLLGEIGFEHLNLYSRAFSSYGSEKRGSPVKSYIYFSQNPIRINTPIREPDLVCIFTLSLAGNSVNLSNYSENQRADNIRPYSITEGSNNCKIDKKEHIPYNLSTSAESKPIVGADSIRPLPGVDNLAPAGNENITSGVNENTAVVVNTDKPSEYVKEKLRLPSCNLWTVDASGIALECNSRANMALFGAMARASGFIDIESCISAAKKYLKGEGNIEAIKSGYENVKLNAVKSNYEKQEYNIVVRNPLKGGINISNGSTVTNDLQGCREGFLPRYAREKCIDCGLCESACPDFVFQFRDGVNLGMDLYHCKGCMRCVEICPTHALQSVREDESYQNIGNIELINKDFHFDSTGCSSIVEGDAYDAEGSTDKSI